MAIPRPGEDRLPPGPVRDLVLAVHDLYDSAGQPGARLVSQAIRRDRSLPETVSHETISALLRGTSLPSWHKINSVIVALAHMSFDQQDVGALQAYMHALWLRTRHVGGSDDNGSEPGTETPIGSRPSIGTIPSALVTPARIAAPRPALTDDQIVGGLPARNGAFIGREILLDGIRRQLTAHPHVVLYGLGGAGKTQLAREYVHRYTDRYAVMWWVPADRAERARASLAGLAERLGVPVQGSAEQTVFGLLSRLESRPGDYLLIFDGAEDEDIRRLMPAIGGHVLITSRDPSWGMDGYHVGLEIPEFDLAEAIQFLRRHDNRLSGQQAERLTQVLGRLPLALEQIAALQAATGQSWDDLVDQLHDARPGLLSEGQPAHYPHSVTAGLRLALDRLAANPLAAYVFELFAWFGPEAVSMALLRSGRRGEVTAPLARALGDPVQINRAIADISRFGLARLNPDNQRIEIQPMTRLALRDTLPPEARARAQHNVQAILVAADPGWPDDLPSTEMHREMAAHILPSGLIESTVESARLTVLNQIRYRYRVRDFDGARQLGQAAVTAWSEQADIGADHELVLQATREWANALRAAGRYQRSRELTADAMRRLEDNPRFGRDHQHTITVAISLAADLRIAGDYRAALRIDEDTYQRLLTRWGEDDRRTLASGHNLAVSLRLLGQYRHAESVDRRDLERHRGSLGEHHLTTLLSAIALAEDLDGLGLHQEALDLLAPILEPAGPVQVAAPDALRAWRLVALSRRRLGQLTDSADLIRAQYARCVESFGADHEHALAATLSMANTLRECGNAEVAYMHATDAVDTYRAAFGPTNPLTLAAEVDLAAILRAKGDRAAARQADTLALAGLSEALGEDHPYSIAATANLATDLHLAGDRRGALLQSKRAYDNALKRLGPDHPTTLATRANHAMNQAALESADSGNDAVDAVLADMRRRLGSAHPNVTQVASGIRIDLDIEPPST